MAIETDQADRAGETFSDALRDGTQGPAMIWIPAGSFMMGDIQGTGWDNEQPVHKVRIEAFALGVYPITFVEYDRFVEATALEKAVSVGSAGRLGTAMRSASRIRKESMDVRRAQETLETTKLELEELDQQLEADIERIEDAFDPDSESLQEILIKPKSRDMTLEFFGLVWMPYRRDARRQLAPDWQ